MKMTETEMRALYTKAVENGMAKADKLFDKYGDRDACGFAWVTIRPGTSRFARFLKKNNYARTAYGGGVSIWCNYRNTQSVGLLEAMARGIADVLREAGIEAYASSRLD